MLFNDGLDDFRQGIAFCGSEIGPFVLREDRKEIGGHLPIMEDHPRATTLAATFQANPHLAGTAAARNYIAALRVLRDHVDHFVALGVAQQLRRVPEIGLGFDDGKERAIQGR
jgi:hypothetical protein